MGSSVVGSSVVGSSVVGSSVVGSSVVGSFGVSGVCTDELGSSPLACSPPHDAREINRAIDRARNRSFFIVFLLLCVFLLEFGIFRMLDVRYNCIRIYENR